MSDKSRLDQGKLPHWYTEERIIREDMNRREKPKGMFGTLWSYAWSFFLMRLLVLVVFKPIMLLAIGLAHAAAFLSWLIGFALLIFAIFAFGWIGDQYTWFTSDTAGKLQWAHTKKDYATEQHMKCVSFYVGTGPYMRPWDQQIARQKCTAQDADIKYYENIIKELRNAY